MYFKFIIAVAALLNASAAGVDIQSAMQCAQETKADFMKVNQSFKKLNLDGFQENEKCFVRCMMRNSQAMSQTGDITVAAMKDLPRQLTGYFEMCKDVGEAAQLCEKAYLFYKCVFDAFKNH